MGTSQRVVCLACSLLLDGLRTNEEAQGMLSLGFFSSRGSRDPHCKETQGWQSLGLRNPLLFPCEGVDPDATIAATRSTPGRRCTRGTVQDLSGV